MKNVITLVLAFLLAANAEAQVRSFPDSSVTWLSGHLQVDNNFVPAQYHYYYYNLDLPAQPDTNIAGTFYRKVYLTDASAGPVYFACFREDTLSHRVYLVEKDSLQEKLIYDFAPHAIGDTLHDLYITTPPYDPSFGVMCVSGCITFYADVRVNGIDSVLIDNVYHTVYQVECVQSPPFQPYAASPGYGEWIEGYGSKAGLFHWFMNYLNLSGHYFSNELNCISRNAATVYPNGSTGSCGPLGIKAKTGDVLSVFPSPFRDHITIEHAGELTAVALYTASGTKVYDQPVQSRTHQVNTTGFADGLYILVAKSRDGIFTAKIVKTED